MPPKLPSVEPGKRLVVSGRTGAGKTTVAAYFLRRSRQHWVILNPKHTAGYKALPDSKVLQGFNAKKVAQSIKENQYTIINFTGPESTPEFMDAVIEWLHNNYKNIGLVADELYTLHIQGRAGPGVIGWLTRGRELKQSWIGLTQRPAWVSRFIFSEADYVVGMDLALNDDRKRMRDNTGNSEFLSRLSPHHWRWYDVSADTSTLWGPVPFTSPST